jgi:predicted ATPase
VFKRVLDSIEIKRFKSISNEKVEFGAVNLFVGGNGSGKSNLLEAIGIASSALARGISDADLATKGVRLSTPALFKSAFKNRKLPSTLRIETKFKNAITYDFELMASDMVSHLRFKTEKATSRNRTIFGRSGNGATVLKTRLPRKPDDFRGMYDQVRSVNEFSDEVHETFDRFARYAIFAPQTEFLRGTEVGSVTAPPVGLHGEGLPQAAASLINFKNSLKASDGDQLNFIESALDLVWQTGWANQVRVGAVDPLLMSPQIKTGEHTLYFRDKFMHSKRSNVTAYDSSEGILFLLFLAVLISHPESPKVFSLDNVDNALNPRMTKYAVSKIIGSMECKNKNQNFGPKQVFMTSHNPTAMDAFDLFDDDLRIFVVSRNDDGHTTVNRLQPPKGITREDWVIKQDGRALSELWIAGEIPGALGANL